MSEDAPVSGISRRTLIRRAAGGTALAAAGPLLAACGSGDENDSGPSSSSRKAPASAALNGALVVSFFNSLNNDYYSSWNLGAKRAVEAFGGKYRFFTNEGDPGRELSQFTQQVQAGARIVFMTTPDSSNIPQIAQLAEREGVFWTNTWEMPPWASPFTYGPHYVRYYLPDGVKAAYDVAKALFMEMGGEGNLVHLTGYPGSLPDSQRTEGLNRALKENPDIKLLAREIGEWDRDAARKVMAGLVTRYGEQINGVFGQNDDVGIGAMNALQEAGITGVPITGIDGNEETMRLIKAGRYFAAFTNFPSWQAGHSAVAAIDASRGWKPTAPERQMSTGGELITKDNVDQYLDKFFSGPDPYDWPLMSRVVHPEDWDPQNEMAPLEMTKLWEGEPKPQDWSLPAPLAEAKASGEFDEVAALYQTNYKRRALT